MSDDERNGGLEHRQRRTTKRRPKPEHQDSMERKRSERGWASIQPERSEDPILLAGRLGIRSDGSFLRMAFRGSKTRSKVIYGDKKSSICDYYLF